MCLAQPAKIIKIEGNKATVSQGDHTHKVDTSMISQKIKEGDYLLASRGFAINKIEKEEAEKIFKLIKESQ